MESKRKTLAAKEKSQARQRQATLHSALVCARSSKQSFGKFNENLLIDCIDFTLHWIVCHTGYGYVRDITQLDFLYVRVSGAQGTNHEQMICRSEYVINITSQDSGVQARETIGR